MKALRSVPVTAKYGKNDVLVVFGELFTKGYANGIVDEALKCGMTVVHSTVGRRESDGSLRPLNSEESQNIPKPFINIPLEAGFDMEPDHSGQTPCEQLKGMKISQWNENRLNWDRVMESKENAIQRFKKNVSSYMDELKKHIPKGANVLFVHTMAGGVPRAKILMPAMNRVFKGKGDRFVPSNDFWNSDIGKLCNLNFSEVTAQTFEHLLSLSRPLREGIEAQGGKVSYVAYGYHGTEILVDDEYHWQTYTPYVQGWAKRELEDISERHRSQGRCCTVYNCPEILTNSSSIFQGVEVSLYPLMGAIEKEGVHSSYCQNIISSCRNKLKEEFSIDHIMSFTSEYTKNDKIKKHSHFEKWPDHNSQKQMEFMLDASNQLIDMHKDPKNLITYQLSEEVFKASGQLMLHDIWSNTEAVQWLNHDIIAQQLAVNP